MRIKIANDFAIKKNSNKLNEVSPLEKKTLNNIWGNLPKIGKFKIKKKNKIKILKISKFCEINFLSLINL